MVSAQQRPLIDYTETNTISSKALSSFHKLSTEELIALLPKVGEEYLEKINSILTERAVKDPSIQEDIKNADEISKRIYDESEKEELLIKKDNCELLRKIIKDMDTAEEMDLLTTGGFSYDALENIKYLSSKQLIALSTIVYDERYMTEIQKNLGSMAGKDEYLMKLVKSQEDRDDHSVPDDNSGHNDR